MGRNNSYSLPGYKKKQQRKAKAAWKIRHKHFEYSRETRVCLRQGCEASFTVPSWDPKKYCSRSCGIRVSNTTRPRPSGATKRKISESMKGTPSPFKGVFKVSRKGFICKNPDCNKEFLVEPWKMRVYCSNACVMHVVGSRPTSPRASRGKAGIRRDIDAKIYFYSRWEANIARLYNHLGVKWEYAPKTFDIGGHTYTPDFYLSKQKIYIEVKNFWGEYSKNRDKKFRKRYPDIELRVILKDEYKELEKQYAHLLPHWEYAYSKVPA